MHQSAGRYICGEETALINALEGKRANPRAKPPFPAIKGLWGQPTVVNNVETLANIPAIITGGPLWWKSCAATPEAAGTKLFCISGHVVNTDCFELPLGMTLGEIIDGPCGGMRPGSSFKACIPGGASTPYFTGAHRDVPMDFDPVAKAGSRLGTGGIIVFDQSTCMVAATLNLIRFFARESCGWCTPCREGLPFVQHTLERIEAGRGEARRYRYPAGTCPDVELLPSAPWPRAPWVRWRGCCDSSEMNWKLTSAQKNARSESMDACLN